MTGREREAFDALLERVLSLLPPALAGLLEEVPLVVEDRPDAETVESLAREGVLEPGEDGADLCGLHSGPMLTERSVEDHGVMPEQIHLFREGIVAIAGGWEAGEGEVLEQIRVTVLHELGHHFGLEEEGLDDLGYA